jgi:short-subunit dehydrogenase
MPRCILITGATSGIGAALAREYAQSGRTLILHGRDAARLAAITKDCTERGARVLPLALELSDGAAAEQALRQLSTGADGEPGEPIDLAIVNAGASRVSAAGENIYSWEAAHEVLAVNLEGAIATVTGVLPGMRRRGHGQIALVSSLAAYFGLPPTPVYCASKAALKAYGEALRGTLAPQGIAVNVILPGFVKTPMSADFTWPKPFLLTPEQAARAIRRGLERNQARIAFPPLLAFGTWWLAVLPAALAQRVVRWMGYGAK